MGRHEHSSRLRQAFMCFLVIAALAIALTSVLSADVLAGRNTFFLPKPKKISQEALIKAAEDRNKAKNDRKPHVCERPVAACGLMVLTSYFTTKQDWQRNNFTEVNRSKLQTLYRSTMELGLNVTIVYDKLPDELVSSFSCSRFSFLQVSLEDYDEHLGVNDVRYFVYADVLANHPSWEFVFTIDAFDVEVAMNPCASLQPDTFYVGSETRAMKNWWMEERFRDTGGKYLAWYNAFDEKTKLLNCGITGGHRSVMHRFFASMKRIMTDAVSDFKSREVDSEVNVKSREVDSEVNVNMAALNYFGYSEFAGKLVTSAPVHSVYKQYQNRNDVWFVHK